MSHTNIKNIYSQTSFLQSKRGWKNPRFPNRIIYHSINNYYLLQTTQSKNYFYVNKLFFNNLLKQDRLAL